MNTAKPKRCINPKPDVRTHIFCGEYISLPAVHMLSGISLSHLSLVFNGKRGCSLDTAQRIAHALKMPLNAFVTALKGKPPNVQHVGKYPRGSPEEREQIRLKKLWNLREAERLVEREKKRQERLMRGEKKKEDRFVKRVAYG